MPPFQPPPSVPNRPLQVAEALRYKNANGDLVTQLYPNDYLSLVGSTTGAQVTQIASINQILTAYQNTLTSLQNQITAIQTSGATAIPQVNTYCLTTPPGQVVPINVATTLLISNTCAYNNVLGTPTQLAQAILAQCLNLNTSPAYSQNSNMAGLAGWNTNPTTIAAALNNLEIAYCDARAGITQALAQSSITCASIIINYSSVYVPSTQVVTFYFYGSSIPAAFSSAGGASGTITITDINNNKYTSTFNIYNAVQNGYIAFNISSSSLSTIGNYNAVMGYALTSTTPSLGCNGNIIGTIINNTAICPNLTTTPSTNSIAYQFTPTTSNNVLYSVYLYNTSGTTSGGTALQTKTYLDPIGLISDNFTQLTSSTTYYIVISITIGSVRTYCNTVTVVTTSS